MTINTVIYVMSRASRVRRHTPLDIYRMLVYAFTTISRAKQLSYWTYLELVIFYVKIILQEIHVSVLCGNYIDPIIDVYAVISAHIYQLSFTCHSISQIVRDSRSGCRILTWAGFSFLQMFKRPHLNIL